MDKYNHSRTCVYKINYHLVWCVKYRRKVLSDENSTFLCDLLRDIGAEKGFDIVSVKVGDRDHVHCFVAAPPTLSVSTIVKYLKGISGRKILYTFPEVTRYLWNGHLWNSSYFVETIGSTSEENILKYIERQKTCRH